MVTLSLAISFAYEPADQVGVNERGTYTIREHEDWLVEVIPAIFNNRLVLTPKEHPLEYSHGWCYDKGPTAFLAAATFDLDTQDEPDGWKKRATPGIRRAPHRDKSPNRERCVHGAYANTHCEHCRGPARTTN